MAFNLQPRFELRHENYCYSDPGAYEVSGLDKFQQNKAPFLSKASRNTLSCNPIWTHNIYFTNKPHFIPNITSLNAKCPRFLYKPFRIEDFETQLCDCDVTTCECPTSEHEDAPICQAKTVRRIMKGSCIKHVAKPRIQDSNPPIYDVQVLEASSFYKGCKWSRWTSRKTTPSVSGPGPADYSLEKNDTDNKICYEQFREYRRRTSKQPRYIEIIQRQSVLENRPGPNHYDPKLQHTNLCFTGPKAERFAKEVNQNPSPTEYTIKRDFEVNQPPTKRCHVRLPDPACFGVKAKRFVYRSDGKPSPASYYVRDKICHIVKCSKAPFNSSSKRFKDTVPSEIDSDGQDNESEQEDEKIKCPNPTWVFQSKTLRFTPLISKINKPKPVTLLTNYANVKSNQHLKRNAPFGSSEERFRTWYNWIPVFNSTTTPGPGELDIEGPRILSAVSHGPLSRASRFPKLNNSNPAPNEYKIEDELGKVLKTHNRKLKHNIEKKYKFNWTAPSSKQKMSYEEKEMMLLNRMIATLGDDGVSTNDEQKQINDKLQKPKLLNWFLYKHPMANYG